MTSDENVEYFDHYVWKNENETYQTRNIVFQLLINYIDIKFQICWLKMFMFKKWLKISKYQKYTEVKP